MAKEIALDTSVLVGHFRNELETTERLEEFERLWIPVPVIAELMTGILKLKHSLRRKEEFESFIESAKIIDCTREVAEHFANIKIELQSRGAMIPVNDIWIAACCISRNKQLATRDAHFQKVPGLEVEAW